MENWEKFSCCIKAKNIVTYFDAMGMEKLFSEKFSDTKQEERLVPTFVNITMKIKFYNNLKFLLLDLYQFILKH